MKHVAVCALTVCATVVWPLAFLPVAAVITLALVVQGEIELRRNETQAKEGK